MANPAPLLCPECEGGHIVIKTVNRDGKIFRRRACKECGYRFWTSEKLLGDGETCKIEKGVVAAGLRQFANELGLGGHI